MFAAPLDCQAKADLVFCRRSFLLPCYKKSGRTPCGARPLLLYSTKGERALVWRRSFEELGFVQQINVLTLEASPLLGVLVVDRIDEAMPVLFIDKVLVGAIVETGITAFFAELDVLHVRLGRQNAVIVFPCT